MTRSALPVLTIRHDGSRYSFTAAHEVIVGRDLHADVWIPDPRISHTHLILRFDKGRWLAIDNGSLNGTYLNGYRMPVVDIHDGQSINVGNPNGPCLTFAIGPRCEQISASAIRAAQAQTASGRRPLTRTWRLPPVPTPARPNHHRSYRLNNVSRRRPVPSPAEQLTVVNATPQPAEVTVIDALSADVSDLVTKAVKSLPRWSSAPVKVPGSTMVGRASDNDVVIADVLASRRHATIQSTALGAEIRDCSINGTFVNGTRVGSAILVEDDVVTIGNVDLVFRNGGLVHTSEALAYAGGLRVSEVNFSVDSGKQLLDNISLIAKPGTLTAVIGGSGAGKSTLARLIAGYERPSSGSVSFDGHDVHANYASLRSRIGMVPQDDVVHRQLTVNQALGYAAELRLPPDTGASGRAEVVAEILKELDLTKHADTRIDQLSGGQRKRASVALELLTGPALLILDEPTSGLDPALDHQVMTMLRQLADGGRVVIVVTHMLSYLDTCDQLLLVAPGGKTAYYGPPEQIGATMGTTNWAEIFSQVGANPEEANRRFLARKQPQQCSRPPATADGPAKLGEPVRTSVRRQISTVARRQIRLIVADRAYFVFLALLPFVLGALALTVPGSSGFRVVDEHSGVPDEAAQILNLLVLAAAFMGTALTIRDLVGERAIFRREQAVGLSTTAYLLAKTTVFCGFAVLQAAITTTIVVLGKSAPTRGAVLLGHSALAATVELFVTVAATCVASAILGLGISALVRSSEQIMPLFVVSIMAQLVLCGGMVPVTGRFLLDQLSWMMPARWGYAAGASTVDLLQLVPAALQAQDRFWRHTSKTWLLDIGMLAALSAFYAGFLRWKLRLRR